MLDFYVTAASAVAMFLLGLTIVARNLRNQTLQLFGLLTLTAISWFVTNYLTNHVSGYSNQLFFNKLSLFVGFLLILSVWLLSLYFPKKLVKHRIQRVIAWILTPLLLFVTLFTNQVVSSVVYVPEKMLTDINTGNLYIFYVVVAVIFFGFLAFNFYNSFKSPKLNSLEKQQVLFAAIGLLLSFAWSILTAAVIPSISGNWEISKYGAIGSWFIVSFVSYAIVRHKLFDIRLVIARSVGYILLLVTFVGLYGIIAFGLADALFGETIFSERIVPVLTALILAFTSPYFRRYFDKVTNKLFYKDAYDSQEFLGAVNKLLVGQIQLETLLKGITGVIEENLKTSYCVFVIRETGYEGVRIVGTEDHKFNGQKIEELRKLAPHVHRKVLLADDLGEYQEQLESVLKPLDISVLVRLVSNTSVDIEGMGYLVLGPKKNGSIYSSQDKQVLEILANEMVIAVENALRFEEIQKFNITLQEKIDDATKKLRKTNEKLKAMDETKDEFISMASHQLRTPLTSVKGYLSMVLEGDVGALPEMQKKLLDQAFVSSQRMVYLIADLLNVSRLKTGKFIIDSVPTNLAQVVADEIGQLTETAKARKLDLVYEKPEDFPVVSLDETKIRQVVMNFLDNAIYYTPADGKITVQVKDTGSAIEYTVTDSGIGIPKWDQAHLFTKFYRAGNAKKARPDGTGLGLFMAKKVIVAQGGSIIFKSEEGKGSTFGFSFEKEKLQQIADEQAKKEEVTHPKPSEAAKS